MSEYVAGKRFKIDGESVEPGSVVNVKNEDSLGSLIRGGYLISREDWERPVVANRRLRLNGETYMPGDRVPAEIRSAKSFDSMLQSRLISIGRGVARKPEPKQAPEPRAAERVAEREVRVKRPVKKAVGKRGRG